MNCVPWFIDDFKIEYFYENLPYDNFIFDSMNNTAKKAFLSKFFKLPATGKQSRVYWTARGFSDTEANFYRKSHIISHKGKSPFTIEYWLNKGYSKDEAEYQRNRIRPVCAEYWIERGYSQDDAKIKAKETLQKNSITASKNALQKTGLEYKSQQRKEYWIIRGYTEQEAAVKVSQRQATFSLKKCIEKYGTEKGIQKWEERQKKWQLSLKSKSSEEISEINSKKSIISLHLLVDKEFDEIFDILNGITPIAKTVEEYFNNLKSSGSYLLYVDFEYFMLKLKVAQKNWFLVTEQYEEFVETAKQLISEYSSVIQTKHNNFIKRVEEGLLRSSFEIYFYDKIKPYVTTIDIGRQYPNSSYMYDFFIDEKYYIEIAPNYNVDEEYKDKMNIKHKLFNSVILKSISEIDKYVEEYINAKGYNNRTIDSFC